MNTKRFTIGLIATIAAIAIALTLIARGGGASDASAQLFDAGNQAVAAGDYPNAIQSYQSLIGRGQHSAAIYHNLAVAHHRAGDFGAAILNYERAAQLDPGGADIRTNLERARKDSANLQEPQEPALRLANTLGASAWSAIGFTAFCTLALVFLGRSLRLLDWPKSNVRLVAGLASLAMAVPVAAIAIQHHAARDRAIITADTASLRVSPFEGAKSLTSLAPGRAIRLVGHESHADYRLAELGSGQTGWVKLSEFELPIITTK